MSSILDVLLNNKLKLKPEKLGEMLSKQLDDNLPGRVFNGFPPMLPEAQMQSLLDEYVAIIQNAKIADADKIPRLSSKDTYTLAAIDKWFAKVTATACAELFDLNGEPSENLMIFLKLDEAHKTKLKSNPKAMLSSFCENIGGLAAEEVLKQVDYQKYLSAYAVITGYANKKFEPAYFAVRQKQFVGFIEGLSVYAKAYDSTLVEEKAKIDSQLLTLPEGKEKDDLHGRIKAIFETRRSINRFLSKTTSADEFLDELKKNQELFKTAKKFLMFSHASIDPDYQMFVQGVSLLVGEFNAGLLPQQQQEKLKK
jgi:hypothetical protein